MTNQIKALRKRADLTLQALADRVGTTRQQIHKLENGERRLTVEWMRRLADALDCDVADLVAPRQMESKLKATEGLQPVGTEVIFVRGAVQAGHWLEAVELNEQDWETIFLPPDPRFPPQARYALRVAGKSMDLVYPPDTILVCVSIHDYGEPNPGRNVIVYRKRPDGLIEATVKTLRAGKDGKPELWPQSSSPDYAEPVRFTDVTDGEEVEVVGVVIGSYRRE